MSSIEVIGRCRKCRQILPSSRKNPQPKALQDLLTESSQVFTCGNPGWAEGARRSAEYLSRRFARPYTLTPTASHFNGRMGWITGYYMRGEGASTMRLGYFHLTLERAGDGEWRNLE